MLISVVIPVFNSERHIERTLNSILEQKCAEYDLELIAVNDGSKDSTLEILNRFSQQITILNQENQGPATARNTGGKAANGEIILFTDSDTVPHKDWINKMFYAFQDPEIHVCAGTYSIANPQSYLARIIQSEIENRYSRFEEYIRFGGTYNLGVRKALFMGTGGFNESFRHASGEDNDFCYKILKTGNKIKFCPEAKVAHFHTEHLFKYLEEQYRHGFWRAKLYFSHPGKVSGDDYTAWKDIIEPPLCLLSFFMLLNPFSSQQSKIKRNLMTAAFFAATLFLLEILSCLKLGLRFSDFFVGPFIMFLRAFSRTAGFLHGILKMIVSTR